MYPLWNSRFVSENGWPLTPTAFRGLTPGIRIPAGIRYRGDPIKVRGRLILDCGHIGANNEARSEIHPPTAIAGSTRRRTRPGTEWSGCDSAPRPRSPDAPLPSGHRSRRRFRSPTRPTISLLRRASDLRLGDRREVTHLSEGISADRDDRRIPRPQLRSPMGPHRPAGAMPRLATAKWRSVPDSETGRLGGASERNGGLQRSPTTSALRHPATRPRVP